MKGNPHLVEEINNSVGRKYGRLTILGFSHYHIIENNKKIRRLPKVKVVCDCGEVKVVLYTNVRDGKTKSCRCLAQETTSKLKKKNDGRHENTKEYTTWTRIINRCYNKNSPDYPDYGGRGIQVYKKWLGKNGFYEFFKYVGNAPTKNHTLDRFPNNDGNYSPGNVRWANPIQQANNKRNTRYLLFKGVKTKIGDVSKEIGVSKKAIYARLRNGYSESEATNINFKKKNRFL
jgi:hypothetical protein